MAIGEPQNTDGSPLAMLTSPLLAVKGQTVIFMKKLFATFTLAILTIVGYAQSQNLEPEYVGQVAVVNADSTTTLLDKEITTLKSKSSMWGLVPVPGSSLLDKSKMNIVIKGTASKTKLKRGRLTFIIRAEKNDFDPKAVFGVLKFEVKKKTREFLIMKSSILSGSEQTTRYNNVETKIKKYGSNSYIVTIEDAQPGEYGIMTDFGTVYSFGVE